MVISKWKINTKAKKKVYCNFYTCILLHRSRKKQIFLGNMCHWRNFCLDIELFSTTFFFYSKPILSIWNENSRLEKIDCISNVNRTHKVIITTREKKNLDTQYCWYTFSLMKYALRNKSNSHEHWTWTYHTYDMRHKFLTSNLRIRAKSLQRDMRTKL